MDLRRAGDHWLWVGGPVPRGAAAITIGIPTFFLALAPSTGPWRPEGYLKAIARFSIPAGIACGLGILASYLRHGDRVFETYFTTGRGNEIMAPSYGLLDRTVYGRQEHWEDSPEGWPKYWGSRGDQMRHEGRPTAQWSRVLAGRSDDLGEGTDGASGGGSCH